MAALTSVRIRLANVEPEPEPSNGSLVTASPPLAVSPTRRKLLFHDVLTPGGREQLGVGAAAPLVGDQLHVVVTGGQAVDDPERIVRAAR